MLSRDKAHHYSIFVTKYKLLWDSSEENLLIITEKLRRIRGTLWRVGRAVYGASLEN
jgi:hypothetical protein